VLDNDANNLQESKGADTLKKLEEKGIDIPIIYTSFQPGWVPEKVLTNKNVRVIQTGDLKDVLKKDYGLKLFADKKSKIIAPETNIIVTYNSVEGYRNGVFNNGQLIIVSYDKHAADRAREVTINQVREIYQDFDWRRDKNIIKNIFVYDGLNGGTTPGYVASALSHDVRIAVKLLACDCDWDRKRDLANRMWVDLYRVECGGGKTLGMIADTILGITRPELDYSNMRIPKEKVLETAKRLG
jgi:hypothetical protein